MATTARQYELPLHTPTDHHERLHHDAHGTVIYWQRRVRAQHWVKVHPSDPVPQLVAPHQGQPDRYLSVNEFCGWRLVRLLKSLRACYVDIDGTDSVKAALNRCAYTHLPPPTFIVKSGRGQHLYWLLEPLPAKALPGWQRVENALVAAFEPLKADASAKDCTRVLRVAGSIHRERGVAVEGLIVSGRTWKLHELADAVLGKRPPKPAPRGKVRDIRPRQRKRRTPASGSIYERWHKVYQDLLLIADYQWFGGIEPGFQDLWLFLAGVALSWFTHAQALEDELLAQARTWTPEWTADEVRQKLKPVIERAMKAADGETIQWNGKAVDPRYRFRRQTLWSWCKDMVPEPLVEDLRAIIPDELAHRRKQERDSARWSDHYTGRGHRAGNEQKRATARLMRAQGRSIRAIARELGVGVDAVHRWCR